MKLFQWVHRKFRQNSSDPFQDFTFGNPCTCLTVQSTLDDQYPHTNPSFSSTNQSRFSKSRQQESRASYSEFEDKRDEGKFEEETSTVISEIFQGFLTIGTLGAETVSNEPATPTFATPSEDIAEMNPEVTENDLKLINYELEKFLEAENKEERFYESSGRNSHVSTITLSGKQIDGADDEDYGSTSVCPLQGYLFGSSIELTERVSEVRKERASLGELFHRTKITNQDFIETRGSGEIEETEFSQTHKSAKHIIRKMFKKIHSSSKNSTASEGDGDDSAARNKRFHKVLRMFHRKVYPENCMNAKACIKSQKGKIKSDLHDCCHGNDTGDPTCPDKSAKGLAPASKSRKWSTHWKAKWNQPQRGFYRNCSSGKREHWIKTDSEYLVLEL
ncbi:hypothetical protein L6164_004942 [Bauhinia variegata]|uniref:Uncharacterized protein n=1 Tax=Bauhinia variegata TaxID=167791 RepID=A0ACB9PSB4_BAUVA|nr:hypothetical protein L6164_004942 [Bauhinia variegata]